MDIIFFLTNEKARACEVFLGHALCEGHDGILMRPPFYNNYYYGERLC